MTQGKIGWRAYVNPFTPEDPGIPNTIDQDSTNFIIAAGISDSVQISAIETLVSDLKSYGLWTKMKAIYPFVGGSAASHKWNLKDPRNLDAAYRLVFNGGWAHSSNGVLPNGSNAFAETRFNPTSLTSNSAHLSYYSRTSTGFAGYEIGSIQTSNMAQLALITRYSDDKQYAFAGNYNALPSTTNTDGRGFYITNRNSSTNTTGFKNITKTIDTTQTGGLPNVNLCIGAYFMNGSNIGGYGNKESAFASIGDGLTDTEAANFYIAIQKFQTTLGRHIGTPYVSDPDAVAFLTAAGITDGTQAAAINSLVIRMKADGLWNKMKAIYPFVGGSATSHKFNLKDPRDLDVAYRLVFNGGWTHTSTGALPNGTTGYADTKLKPSTDLNINEGSLGFYSRTNNSGRNSAEMGSITTNPNPEVYFQIHCRMSDNRWYVLPNTTGALSQILTTNDSMGFYQGSRLSSTSIVEFKNNIYSTENVPYVSPTTNVLIGARTQNGLPAYFSDRECGFAYIGNSISTLDITNFYNAVQAYQTTLGRQVNVPLVSDTDAQAFLNAANITSFQQASAVNKLVVDLKAAGVWTKMKAIYPFVGGSATSHKWNLKDPRDLDAAYRLVFNGGWTHTSTGAQPNGTTGYADTFLNEYSKLTSGDNHISAYVNTNEVNSGYPYVIGTYNPVNNRGLAIRTFGSDNILRFYNKNNVDVSNTSANSTGFWLNIAKSNRFVGLKNSTKIIDTIPDNAIVNGMISLACVRWTDIGATQFSSQQQVFASIGDGLTDTEATAFYTAVQTYQTSLGRHVATPVYNNGLVLNLDAGNANSYPGTGTTWFDLASGNNGTLVNGPTYDTTNGGSLLFDGTNDYGNFGNIQSLNSLSSGVTVGAWIKTSNASGYNGIVQKWYQTGMQGGFQMFIYPNGTLGVAIGDFINGYQSFASTTSILTGNWIYCSLVYDMNTIKIYLNGVLNGSTSCVRSIVNSNNATLYVGQDDYGSRFFKGNISNLNIYNRALSATEILNNFNSTRGRFGL